MTPSVGSHSLRFRSNMKTEKEREPQLRHRLELLELCMKTTQEQRNQVGGEFWKARTERNETLQKLERKYESKRKEIMKPLADIEKAQKQLDGKLYNMRSEAEEIRKRLHHIERSRKYNFLPGKRLATPLPMVSG